MRRVLPVKLTSVSLRVETIRLRKSDGLDRTFRLACLKRRLPHRFEIPWSFNAVVPEIDELAYQGMSGFFAPGSTSTDCGAPKVPSRCGFTARASKVLSVTRAGSTACVKR